MHGLGFEFDPGTGFQIDPDTGLGTVLQFRFCTWAVDIRKLIEREREELEQHGIAPPWRIPPVRSAGRPKPESQGGEVLAEKFVAKLNPAALSFIR